MALLKTTFVPQNTSTSHEPIDSDHLVTFCPPNNVIQSSKEDDITIVCDCKYVGWRGTRYLEKK